MPKEETIELRHIRNTIGENVDNAFIQKSSSLSSKINSLMIKNFSVPHLIHQLGALGLNKSLTLDVGENGAQAVFSDGTYIYIGLEDGKITRVSASTFTKVSTLQLSIVAQVLCIISDGTFLYAGLDNDKIIKINIQTFTETDTVTITGASGLYCMTTDGTSIYCSDNSDPTVIGKVNINTFNLTTTLTLAGLLNARGLYTDGYNLYVSGQVFGTASNISKIDLGTFTETVVISTDDLITNSGNGAQLVSDGIYLYQIKIGDPTSAIAKVDLTSFNIKAYLTINIPYAWVATIDNEHIYVGKFTATNLSIINIATFT